MAPRPANPPPDRRAEILEAALSVFAEKGYAAATNNDIARAAGVTAAALYYYFPSKADLFRAAITERRGEILPKVEQVQQQLREMPPQVVFPFVMNSLLQFIGQPETKRLLKIILAEGPRTPELIAIWQEQVLDRAMALLFDYVQHQMEIGNMKRMDPRLVMLSLQGPIFAGVIMRDLINLPALSDLTNDQIVSALVETVLPNLLAKKE